MTNEGLFFTAGAVTAVLMWFFLGFIDGHNVTPRHIDIGNAVCENNGGLESFNTMGLTDYRCNSGAKFSWIAATNYFEATKGAQNGQEDLSD